VRTAIVDGEDVSTLSEQADDTAADTDDEPPGRAKLNERSRTDKARRSELGHAPHSRTSSIVEVKCNQKD